MKFIKYFLLGIIFGIILTKGELISWFRIYEMFRFESFHMYGVLGSSVLPGIILILLIRKLPIKSINKEDIVIPDKEMSYPRYLIGGIIFGLGWVMTGACPGPIFILLGNGYTVFIIVFIGAIIGTMSYGILKPKLPH